MKRMFLAALVVLSLGTGVASAQTVNRGSPVQQDETSFAGLEGWG
jgi:hypothetical protein